MEPEKEYSLFLDDERKPKMVDWIQLPLVEWYIVKDVQSFIRVISHLGLPKYISFDHDLNEEHYSRYERAKVEGKFDYNGLTTKTGYEAAKWLVRYCEIFKKPMPQYFIHTKNKFGAANIKAVLDGFKQKVK